MGLAPHRRSGRPRTHRTGELAGGRLQDATVRIRRLSPLAFAVALTTGAATSCGTGPPPRSDIAIIESGDAEIREIDRVAVRGSPIGEFPVRPGAHNRVRVVVIDRATGQPPVTPCGPDEDDD